MATHSCLETPMDRGTLWATVHGVTRSETGLKRLTYFVSPEAPLGFQTACCSLCPHKVFSLCRSIPAVSSSYKVGLGLTFSLITS